MQEKEIQVLNEQQEKSIELKSEQREAVVPIKNDIIEFTTSQDYEVIENKPQINSVELVGNLSADELGLQNKIVYTQLPWQEQPYNLWDLADGNYNLDDNSPIKLFETPYDGTQANTITPSYLMGYFHVTKESQEMGDTTLVSYNIDADQGSNLVKLSGVTMISENINLGMYSQLATTQYVDNLFNSITDGDGVSY